MSKSPAIQVRAVVARELKRAIHRLLMQPLARQIALKAIPAGATVHVDTSARRGELEFEAMKMAA